jgi:hypothetical protein
MPDPDSDPDPDIVLTFRPLPDAEDVPVGVRVRQLLRTALRRDRLKCVKVEGLPPETKQDVDERSEQ